MARSTNPQKLHHGRLYFAVCVLTAFLAFLPLLLRLLFPYNGNLDALQWSLISGSLLASNGLVAASVMRLMYSLRHLQFTNEQLVMAMIDAIAIMVLTTVWALVEGNLYREMLMSWVFVGSAILLYAATCISILKAESLGLIK